MKLPHHSRADNSAAEKNQELEFGGLTSWGEVSVLVFTQYFPTTYCQRDTGETCPSLSLSPGYVTGQKKKKILAPASFVLRTGGGEGDEPSGDDGGPLTRCVPNDEGRNGHNSRPRHLLPQQRQGPLQRLQEHPRRCT